MASRVTIDNFDDHQPLGNSPMDTQVGGSHYKNFVIQPGEYIRQNKLGWYEGNVVKYVSRHKSKNGLEDINKAIHYLEMIKEEYIVASSENILGKETK